MRINVECLELKANNKLSLEENGIVALLETVNNKGVQDLEELIGVNDIALVINCLKKLNQKGVFKLTEANENNSLVLNIINEEKERTSSLVNISKNKQIQICFQLDEKKLATITERSTDAKSFKFNLVNISFNNYYNRKLNQIEINSEAEFITFLNSVTPIELIRTHGKQLTLNDFDHVFELIKKYDCDMGLINFAIDYSITESKFGNLSYAYVEKLLQSWTLANVISVAGGLEFVRKFKQEKMNKASNFVAPEYDKPQANETKVTDLKQLFAEDNKFE